MTITLSFTAKSSIIIYMEKKKSLWEFIKFNLVSFSVTIVQLLLANILPIFFDDITTTLPPLLQIFFDPKVLFTGESKYVINGVVTYGYILPFLLSNGLANIYGYFVNMKTTFKGQGSKKGFVIYIVVLIILILFSCYLQGIIVGKLNSSYARTIASLVAGFVQMCVLFPLEKYVLFKQK